MKLSARALFIGIILSVAMAMNLPAAPQAAEPPASAPAENSAEKASTPPAASPQQEKPEEKIAQTPGADIPEAGKKIFSEKNCGACHTTLGPEKKIPVTKRAGLKGPSLWYVGSKFRPGYLAAWLVAPRSFRGVRWGTMDKGETSHPALPRSEAGAVAAYLESLRDNEMPTGAVPEKKKIPRRVLRTARILFQKKQPCYSCHRVKIRKTVYRRPIKLGGFSGPQLIDAGRRLRSDFIVAFLKNPARYNPNGRMPIYSDKAFTRLSDKDIIALATYISSFKEKP